VFTRQVRRKLAAVASVLAVTGLVALSPLSPAPPARADVTVGDVIFSRAMINADGQEVATHLMRLSGGTINQITNLPSDYAFYPEVSADGSKVVFQDTQVTLNSSNQVTAGGQGIWWVLDTSDGQVTQLTYPDEAASDTDPSQFSDTTPMWSPNGSEIVFVRSLYDTSCSYPWVDQIFSMAADGSSVTDLTPSDCTDSNPVWSPDGTKIAYDSIDGYGDRTVYVMDANGSNAHVVDPETDCSGGSYPQWTSTNTMFVLVGRNSACDWSMHLAEITSSDSFSDATGSTETDIGTFTAGSTAEDLQMSADASTAYMDDGDGHMYSMDVSTGATSSDPLTTSDSSYEDSDPSPVGATWPHSSDVTLSAPSVSDAPYTRQITINLSSSGIERFEYGWSTSSTTAPDTSYLQSTTNLSTGIGTLNYLGVYSGSGTTWDGGTTPDTDWYLWVRSVNTGGSANSWGQPLLIHTPKAPAWIGVGDSYTSGWHQDSDELTCVIVSAGDCSVTQLDTSYSWLSTAVGDFNTTQHIPSGWQMTETDYAIGGAATSSFGASGETPGTYAWATGDTQAAWMRDGLTSQSDSWNVVSVTGGAIDAGLQDTLGSWYALHTSPPWNLTSAGDCPDTNTMYNNLTTGSPTGNATITANLQGIVDVAVAASPSVRVLSVGYSEILDSGNVCQGDRDGGSTKGAGSVVTQLNDDHSGLSGANVKYVDLVDALGTTPVSDGDIQETRIYGYPHPDSSGQILIGEAAYSDLAGYAW
jgi:hypothetical protein